MNNLDLEVEIFIALIQKNGTVKVEAEQSYFEKLTEFSVRSAKYYMENVDEIRRKVNDEEDKK